MQRVDVRHARRDREKLQQHCRDIYAETRVLTGKNNYNIMLFVIIRCNLIVAMDTCDVGL